MAINQNHLFEDLDGIKCAVVEKNLTAERLDFLKTILEFNGYKVVAVNSPPPKAAIPPAPDAPVVSTPTTFTLGVTDVTFNAVNAIFGRLLKTPDGKVVTLAYWQQKEKDSDDTKPYFSKGNK
jgi:hypothetical protein